MEIRRHDDVASFAELAMPMLQADPVRHEALADFVVTGSLKLETFGMTSDEAFISNRVKLVLKARLELPEAGHAG